MVMRQRKARLRPRRSEAQAGGLASVRIAYLHGRVRRIRTGPSGYPAGVLYAFAPEAQPL